MLFGGATVRADESGARSISWEPRVALGNCLSAPGSLLTSKRPGQPWQVVGDKEEIMSRDLLMALPGMKATVEPRPRSVKLTLLGNLPEQTDFRGLQSAVILHDSRAFDLDFTLRRGRVLIVNDKEKGLARVWLRIEEGAYELTLSEPGDRVMISLYGSWPRGVAFAANPNKRDVPTQSLNFDVLKGQVDLKSGGTQFSLSAPPGPSHFHWDSVNGDDGGPSRGRKPTGAGSNAPTPEIVAEVVARYQKLVQDNTPAEALGKMLEGASAKKDQARITTEFAVYGFAALDDVDRVLQILSDPQRPAARHTAIVALRHWIGDTGGRDQRLFQFLLDRLGYSRAQAATVLQLLHSPYAADDPEAYETLIAYLRHENLGVRELAAWHLSRLVPKELQVPYDAAGTEAERAKAYAAWKKQIPSGSLPMKKPKKK
jgi:hypothetical protein